MLSPLYSIIHSFNRENRLPAVPSTERPTKCIPKQLVKRYLDTMIFSSNQHHGGIGASCSSFRSTLTTGLIPFSVSMLRPGEKRASNHEVSSTHSAARRVHE